MRIAVGFATCGRPEVLSAALRQISAQTRQPDLIIICYTKTEDITGLLTHEGVILHKSEAGLPRQRNAILQFTGSCDVIVFFDDDFFAAPNYLQVVENVFTAQPSVVAATGRPIADGIKGPGIAQVEALRLIAADTSISQHATEIVSHAYGCNMAIRLKTVREHGLAFDVALPLYGWSEDVDFTHRIGRWGLIVKMCNARGVHLGVKSARSSGRKLGYSQVANPIYLRKKGSYSWWRAFGSVGRNFAANSARSLWSEPYIDRRGRLLGNICAFGDLLRGRLTPGRILEL